MRYVLLLRGVNVGGKNKVVMADLKNNLEVMGYTHVKSYINSGNVFFNSEDAVEEMTENLHTHFSHTYDFELLFVILGADEFIQEYHNLPEWWQDDFARKDVLFYTDSIDKAALRQTIEAMNVGDEIIYFGELAVYWGKYSEASYKKTAYARYLIRTPFYKKMTIRNGKTFERIYQMLLE